MMGVMSGRAGVGSVVQCRHIQFDTLIKHVK